MEVNGNQISLVLNILQNIFLFHRKKKNHTYLKWHDESEQIMNFHFFWWTAALRQSIYLCVNLVVLW